MDIIKAFQKNEIGINITIKGTCTEPLFRASDIGEVLEMSNINKLIGDFDREERVSLKVMTPGGEQEVTFLTEFGLYQVLFTSRKPIAKQFKKWVCVVIKEIRINGMYNLENQLEEKDRELLGAKENTLLETYKNTRGVYLAYIDYDKQIVKFGHGTIGERVKRHKKEIGEEFSLQYVIDTQYDRELETLIKRKLKDKVFSKNFENRRSACTELIQLDKNYTIENLYRDVIKLKKLIKDEVIIHLKEQIKNLKMRLNEDDSESELSDFDEVQMNEETKEETENVKIKTERKKVKVYKFKIEENKAILINTFDSVREAAKRENITESAIIGRIKCGSNIDNHIWSYEENIPLEIFSTKRTKVYKLDTDLNVLQIFDSIQEASDKENISTRKMQRMIKSISISDGIIYSKVNNPVVNVNYEKWKTKAVNKIDVCGNITKTFRSVNDAIVSEKIPHATMCRLIKNKIMRNNVYYEHAKPKINKEAYSEPSDDF
jgi:prophage antirepressor-like protein